MLIFMLEFIFKSARRCKTANISTITTDNARRLKKGCGRGWKQEAGL